MAKKKFGYKSKNTITIIFCVTIAAALIFVVQPLLSKQQNKTAEIIVSNTYITKGSEITAADVQKKEVGSFGLPPGVIEDQSSAVGQRAQIDIVPGDYLTTNKVGEQRSEEDAGEILKAGKRLVTVTLNSAAAGVASNLSKSDFVDVAVVMEDGETYQSTVMRPQELKNIQIFSIENSRGQSVEPLRSTAAENKDTIASTATLIVTDQQATELVKAEYSGKIHLIFTQRGGSNE